MVIRVKQVACYQVFEEREAADGDKGEAPIVLFWIEEKRELERRGDRRRRRGEREGGLTTSELVENRGGCRCVCMIYIVSSSSCNLCQIFNLT